jgi:hypothetical protein
VTLRNYLQRLSGQGEESARYDLKFGEFAQLWHFLTAIVYRCGQQSELCQFFYQIVFVYTLDTIYEFVQRSPDFHPQDQL